MLRFDIWLCLALGFLVSLLTVRVTRMILPETYKSYVKKHTVAAGDIGGVAGDDIFQAQNVQDLLDHDLFTVVSPGMEYSNKGAGYYKDWYMYALTLPSGERVAAVINQDGVQHTGDDIFSGTSILPVGRVVYEDLTEHETFLNQIGYSTPLTRTDFYVDMLGGGGAVSQESYEEVPVLLTQALTVILCFPIFHGLGAKLGLFPYFFAPKKKRASEWE